MKTKVTSKKKQIILEKSFEILLYEGLTSLTIKNIAQKVSFVESAVYKHYSSKNEILQDIISFVEKECDTIVSIIDSADSTPQEKILRYVDEWNSAYMQKPFLIPVLFSKELFRFDQNIILRIQSILQKQIALLNLIILDGQTKGLFIDTLEVNTMRLIITSPWILAIDSWFYSGRSPSLIEDSRKLVDEVLKLVRT